MKKTITYPINVLIIFLFLLSSASRAQEKLLDSVKSLLQAKQKDTSWIWQADKLFPVIIERNISLAKEINSEVFKISLNYKYPKGLALAYHQMGDICWLMLQFDSSRCYLDTALVLSEKINDLHRMAKVYTSMGINNIIYQRPEVAADLIYKSLRLNETLNDTGILALNYENLGLVYWLMKNYKKSENYHLKAITLYQSISDSNKIAMCLINYASSLSDAKRFRESAARLQQSAILCESQENFSLLSSLYNSLGWLQIMIDSVEKYSSVFKNDSLLRLSLNYLMKSVTLCIKYDFPQVLADNYTNMGQVYYKLGDHDKAIAYLNKGLSQGIRHHQVKVIMEASGYLYQVYSSKKDYRIALQYHEQFMIWHDSSFAIQKNSEIERLNSVYEAEKKDNQIALLNKDKNIREKVMENQMLMRNFLIFGFILVFILVIVTYSRYRIKLKSNKKLSAAFTELKKMQDQLVDSEKRAAFGLLTARIAHEIQNPLNFVKNFSELAMENLQTLFGSKDETEKTEASSDLEDNLQKINHHSLRADAIIKKLQEHLNAGKVEEFFI